MSEHDDEQYPLTRGAEDLAWGSWNHAAPPIAAVFAREAGMHVIERAQPETFAGSKWKRREPEGDAADHVEFVTLHPVGEHGGAEVVARCIDFAGVEVRSLNANGEIVTARTNTLSFDPADFIEQYTREDGVSEAVDAALARLDRVISTLERPA